MRLLLLFVAGFCLTEYASSRPWCRGGTYDPVTKKCVYTRERCESRGGTYDPVAKKCVYTSERCGSGYWDSRRGRCVPRRRPSPAPVCPDKYRWDSRRGRCVRIIRRDNPPRPAPLPSPERGGDARVFEATYYMSEDASVTVTSSNNGVEYQRAVKGTAYVFIKHRTGELFNKLFDSVAEMKSYLIKHTCQVDTTEGMLVFKSAKDAENASMKVLLAEKGSLSSKAKIQIEVSYLHGPPSGRGQAHMRNMVVDCP